MQLRVVQVLILLLAGSLASAAELPESVAWGSTNDVLIQRAFIPSANNRHGEVRLVRRGDVHVVQTLLYSVALKRGLNAIRSKESQAWPAGADYHADSQVYLALMEKAEEIVFAKPPSEDDPRRKLLIEFIDGGDRAYVALFSPRIEGTGDNVGIVAADLLGAEPVSPEYVRRAMDTMMASAFQAPSDPTAP